MLNEASTTTGKLIEGAVYLNLSNWATIASQWGPGWWVASGGVSSIEEKKLKGAPGMPMTTAKYGTSASVRGSS